MPAAPHILTPAELQAFHDDGYVTVRGAFPRADALAMQDAWWAELAHVHGVHRHDRATWRPVAADLRRAKRDPIQQRLLTPRVAGVIDALLGAGTWRPPRDWGRVLSTFPEPGAQDRPWEIPTFLWHWDSPAAWHLDSLEGLFVVSFIGEVAPRGGGTLILAGSPRLVLRQEAGLTPAQRALPYAARRRLFYDLDPWLGVLTGASGLTPEKRTARLEAGAVIDGVPVRVVELTGEPGDMVFCHPCIVHCASPNLGDRPRFMRIRQQLMTERGRLRLSGAA